MQVWNDKCYYDARFVVGDDLYHRLAEIAGLAAVASAVVHIRSVDILSNPSEHVAMFGYCLSMAIVELMVVMRFAEVYYFGIGERSTLQHLALREGLALFVGGLLYLSGAIVAGLEFFGKDDSGVKDHLRGLAEAAAEYSSSESGEAASTNIPVLLCLASMLMRLTVQTIRTVVLFPNDGSHKKFGESAGRSKMFIAVSVDIFLIFFTFSMQVVPLNVDFFIHRYVE
jgi:hypothetical protein